MTVAMGNAKPVLKKKAKYITDDADDDGIYNACRHFGGYEYHSKENKIATHRMAILFSLCTV